MNVFKKLQSARVQLQAMPIKKSGKNTFAGYSYMELTDFIPPINTIFNELGLCGIVSFTADVATLTINDIDDGTSVVFASPMSEASLKGCHLVQNLGAVQTYLRRYLYVMALEIVEHDALDGTTGKIEKEKPPVKKFVPDMAIIEAFAKAATMDELGALWAGTANKTAYSEAKDTAKARIQGANNA